MTKINIFACLATLSVLTLVQPALAQDNSGTVKLPEICAAAGGHDMSAMGGNAAQAHDMSSMGSMDQAHQDLMKGMDEMNAMMMQGMSAKDVDVAFVCGMIPHHQGAINMAKAELAHGDDQWAKEMAQKVIDAQEKEIAEMIDWLSKQPK